MEQPSANPSNTGNKNADNKKDNDNKNKQQQKKEFVNKKSKELQIPEKPEYIAHRVKIWDEEVKRQEQAKSNAPDKPIKVTLPDGKVLDGIAGKTTPMDIALSIAKGLADNAVVAKVNGQLCDLGVPLEEDCNLELFKFDSPEGKKVFWHSSAHILGQALERLYGCRLCVGPPLDDGGFYYDAEMGDMAISSEEYDNIEQVVNKVVADKQPFQRLTISKELALEMFKYNPFKYQILKDKVP